MTEPGGPWLEPEQAPKGLLLFAPPAPPPGFAAELATVLATGAAVAVILDPQAGELPELRACSREQRVACLLLDDVEAAAGAQADGVHLSDPAAVAAARRRLGPEAIIGAACGASRHLAMVAGEGGADYVLFRAEPGDRDLEQSLVELCRWWTELFVLPCAVDLRAVELDAGRLSRAGADFFAVQEAVWEHAAGPAAAARALRRRLDEARTQEQGQP